MLRWYYIVVAAIRSLVARRSDDQVQTDLGFHLEQATAEYIEQGMSPDDARMAALRAFGNQTLVVEEVRDMSFWTWWDRLGQDLRYGLRTFRRNPAFAMTALLSLALGIGANTAVFSVVNAALLRPLPVNRPEQLVLLNPPPGDFSYPHYVALRDGSGVFADLIAASGTRRTGVVVAADDEQAFVKMVSGNYFTGLGVPAAAGRVLTAADEHTRVAVISRGYWSRRFGESPDITGRPITIDGLAFTIIGVATADFLSEEAGEAPDIWTSVALQLPARRDERGYSWLTLIGRLKPGVTRQQAETQLNALLVGAPADGLRRIDVAAGSQGAARLRNMFANPLQILMALAGVVLLIACTNLGSLLLTRAAAREQEISMRLAIGASRVRIVRQLMTESLMLALGGGALGLVFAAWASGALVQMASAVGQTLVLDLRPDLRVMLFTAAVSFAAAVLFGLAPAVRAVRDTAIISPTDLGHRRIGGGGRWRTRDLFIVAQLALSLILLAASAMFSRTLSNLQKQDLGFQVDEVVMIEMAAERGYRPTLSSLIPRLIERAQTIPGVTAASVVFNGPLGSGAGVYGLQIDGYTPQSPQDQRARADWVGPNYFGVTGIPLIEGREFSMSDSSTSQKVAIINQTMARHYFGDRPALGRSFTFNKNRYEIVGIARNAKDTDLRQVTPRVVYFALLQGGGANALALRVAGVAPAALTAPVRAAIREVDPRLTPGEILTMSTRMHRTLIGEHLLADLAGFFSGLTLLLAAIGVYGTLSYTAARRTKEIGIRLALGSRRAAVVWIVLRAIVLRLAVGLLLGLAGIFVTGRLIVSILYGLGPMDPATIAFASLTLILVSLAAGYLPAFRASRLDPVAVLRE